MPRVSRVEIVRSPEGAGKELQIEWSALAVPRRIPFDGNSYQSVQKSLEKFFGPFPLRLSSSKGHDRALRAMECAAGEGGVPYGNLAHALERHGDIEVNDK